MTEQQERRLSSYLAYLPAIFQPADGAGDDGGGEFLGRFLLAFEQVLTGLGDRDEPGLEELLDGITNGGRPVLAGLQRYFDPGGSLDDSEEDLRYRRAPREFLGWLARWVALSLRADMDEASQRALIAQAVSLYRLRGTRLGLEKMIQIYTTLPPRIDELSTMFQLGVTSTVGVDTWLDGGGAHFFLVTLQFLDPDLEARARKRELARAIIDMEKPAHTYYELQEIQPIFRIGVNSTVGVDTLLGPQ